MIGRLVDWAGGWKARLVAISLAVAAFAGAFLKVFLAGKASERREAERKAAEARLKMHQEAHDIERNVADMSDEEARDEALKWSDR